jgi:hypothetical protein
MAMVDFWREFHRSHITDLKRALNVELEPRGYIAHQEDSLQIGFFPDDYKPASDVLIRDVAPNQRDAPGTTAASSVLSLPAATLNGSEEARIKAPAAIKIDRLEDEEAAGLPVTWIELLSPPNKSGHGLESYSAKRDTMLQLRVAFVEIDYLHGISTSLESIPDYRPAGRGIKPSPNAYPYHIWMIDPRLPRYHEESVALASFSVDEPIPVFVAPLSGHERLTFDLNEGYHQTFRLQPGFGRRIDYARPPTNVLDDYNAREQLAIAARMLTVQGLAAQGVDLSLGPFPVDPTIRARLETDQMAVQTLLSS